MRIQFYNKIKKYYKRLKKRGLENNKGELAKTSHNSPGMLRFAPGGAKTNAAKT
jgi:hypothetical protein